MESNNHMLTILEMCVDAVVSINEKGIIDFFNKSAENLWGYDRNEVMGKNIKEFIPLEHSVHHDLYLERFITTGIKKVIGKGREVNLLRKDGTLVPILLTLSYAIVEGKYVFTAFIKDYREIKKNQEKLIKLAHIADKTNNSVVITDIDGKIQWINEGFTKRTGYILEEVIGKRPGSFLQGPDTKKEVVEEISRKIRQGESVHVELLNYAKDGTTHWISSEINPVFDENGNLSSYIAVQNDITELIKKNEDLFKAKKEAETAKKTQEMFLANMSHEIRTPMNAIIGFSEILSKSELNSHQKQSLNIIKKSAENLMFIINDILDFSKIEAGEMTFEKIPFSLKESLNNLVQFNSYKAEEKGLYVKFNYPIKNEDTYIIGDPVRLNQVFLNLLTNAIKFTEKGGVEINIQIIQETDSTIELKFNIVDTGIGIKNDKIKLLFQSFKQSDYTITRKYGGTGLGLSISKKLVELMGGSIGVESEFGKGSTFYFTLNFEKTTADKVLTKNEHTDNSVSKLKNVTILLAEDNGFNQLVVTNYFNEWGCRYEIANDGVEVLEKLKHNTFDIILMDVQMPRMGGVEATEFIRKNSDKRINSIPIIALTANAVKSYIQQYLDCGMNDFVSKPFKASDLSNSILRNVDFSKVIKKPEEPILTLDEVPDIQKLMELANSNETIFKKLIGSFLKQLDESEINFSEALKDSNFEKIRSVAHKVKASFMTIGMDKTYEDLNTLESVANDNKDISLINNILDKYFNTAKGLRDFLKSKLN